MKKPSMYFSNGRVWISMPIKGDKYQNDGETCFSLSDHFSVLVQTAVATALIMDRNLSKRKKSKRK